LFVCPSFLLFYVLSHLFSRRFSASLTIFHGTTLEIQKAVTSKHHGLGTPTIKDFLVQFTSSSHLRRERTKGRPSPSKGETTTEKKKLQQRVFPSNFEFEREERLLVL